MFYNLCMYIQEPAGTSLQKIKPVKSNIPNEVCVTLIEIEAVSRVSYSSTNCFLPREIKSTGILRNIKLYIHLRFLNGPNIVPIKHNFCRLGIRLIIQADTFSVASATPNPSFTCNAFICSLIGKGLFQINVSDNC